MALQESPTVESVAQMIQEQVTRLRESNRQQLEDMIRYADRCKARDDRDGERRYMTRYAELRSDLERLTRQIQQPLIDLAMLRPAAPMVIPAADWPYPRNPSLTTA